MGDPITKPDYYYNFGKAVVGPLDYAEQQDLGIDAHAIVKYVTRAGRKPGNTALKDLKQAMFYLKRMIEKEQPGSFTTEGGWGEKRTGLVDRRICQDEQGAEEGLYRRRGPGVGRRSTDKIPYGQLPSCDELRCKP